MPSEQFYPLLDSTQLVNGLCQVFTINNTEVLLIHFEDNTYIIANKCGHFGVGLHDGHIGKEGERPAISCSQHGISFDLISGEVINRPWENCDPVTVFKVHQLDGKIGILATPEVLLDLSSKND